MPRIALISDTHGLLRPEALAVLRGADHIIHAGDICDDSVLKALAAIAPVTAVRGNNDKGPWAGALPVSTAATFGSIRVHVVHDISDLSLDTLAELVDVVVFGHSHKPSISQRNGVLFINPGSAGRRRFKLPISMAELVIADGVATPRLIDLEALAG